MAVNRLPLPADLVQYEVNQWIEIRPSVSPPTTQFGDWKAYPHLVSKENWRKYMEPRLIEFQTLLESCNVHYPTCAICALEGRGMQSDFAGHISGVHHFKRLARIILQDGQPLNDVRVNLWDEFLLPGGAARINQADGSVEMCRGRPEGGVRQLKDILVAPSQLAIQDSTAALSQPTPLAAPRITEDSPYYDEEYSALDLQQEWKQAPGNIVPLIPTDGRWYRISPRCTWPHNDNGNWSAYPHLQSKNTWKQHMQAPANVMGQILEHFGVYAECEVCSANRSFHEHVPAQKHYNQMWDQHLNKPGPLEVHRNKAWQEWNNLGCDQMCFRFNHIDGETHAKRGRGGAPPQASGLQRPAPPMGPAIGSGEAISSGALPTFGPGGMTGSARTVPVAPMPGSQPSSQGNIAPSQVPVCPPVPPQMGSLASVAEEVGMPRGLFMWLWKRHAAESARNLEDLCSRTGQQPSRLICAVCTAGKPAKKMMDEGVQAHLLSESHVRNLDEVIRGQNPQWPEGPAPSLPQNFKLLSVQFDHATAELTGPGLVAPPCAA
mmetsp:Transcript_19851/g.46157  ORF Transcript_19851/g.46157 Transcript_19851/m.46157 type:complete len:548 (+) Transcript_19851:218-1861(+)